MYRIGVISDTHGLLREAVKNQLQGCDAILHGGDIHKESVMKELQGIAPLYIVRGNADKEWAADLPAVLNLELFGLRIAMIHNKKEWPGELPGADLLVFGHSHKYADQMEGDLRLLNPGSCGPRRFHQPITMAVIETEGNGSYEVERIDIPHEKREEPGKMQENSLDNSFGKNADGNLDRNLDRKKLVETVMKDVDKGKTVEQIADSSHISKELAEQICRMYLTHPGVDVDGILDRIT